MKISTARLVPLLGLVTLLIAGCKDGSSPTDGNGNGSNCDPGILCENITENMILDAGTVYTISGFIKVTNGATLTIPTGTVLQGDFDIPGSSLFILRGSRIVANGSAVNPIVFTSSRPEGQRRAGDWGGLVLVGNGIINRSDPTEIEGTGTDEVINPPETYSGGTDNSDSSGSLRYVRVEFAGFPIAPNNELNAFTFAAVGSNTTAEYLQTLFGLDDSFEIFGGSIRGRYWIAYEGGDDHFDMSEGYVGNLQFLIAFQSVQPEPRAGLTGGVSGDPQGLEVDGCDGETCIGGEDNRNAAPLNIPAVANFTVIGAAPGAWDTGSGNIGMVLRRGTGGLWVNGVIARYNRAAMSLRGDEIPTRMQNGNMRISNIYTTGNAATYHGGQPPGSGDDARYNDTHGLVALANIEAGIADPLSLFTAVPANSATATAASFNWAPAGGSPIAAGGLNSFAGLSAQLLAAAAGITPTVFRGAAAPGDSWWAGWTYYAQN